MPTGLRPSMAYVRNPWDLSRLFKDVAPDTVPAMFYMVTN